MVRFPRFIFSEKFKPALGAHPTSCSVGTGCSVPLAIAVRAFTGTPLPLLCCCMYLLISRMSVVISYIYSSVLLLTYFLWHLSLTVSSKTNWLFRDVCGPLRSCGFISFVHRCAFIHDRLLHLLQQSKPVLTSRHFCL
jgi:hypothetical protein